MFCTEICNLEHTKDCFLQLENTKFPQGPIINVTVLTGGVIENLLHIQSKTSQIREINKMELQSQYVQGLQKNSQSLRGNIGHVVKTKRLVG